MTFVTCCAMVFREFPIKTYALNAHFSLLDPFEANGTIRPVVTAVTSKQTAAFIFNTSPTSLRPILRHWIPRQMEKNEKLYRVYVFQI